MLAPRPTPKLEDHPFSAVRDCLFNIFAATLHIGGGSSIRNLRKHVAVVTGTQLSHGVKNYGWRGEALRLTHTLLCIITIKEHYHVTTLLNFNTSYVIFVDKFGYFNTAEAAAPLTALNYCSLLVLLLTTTNDPIYCICKE